MGQAKQEAVEKKKKVLNWNELKNVPQAKAKVQKKERPKNEVCLV